MGRLDNVAKHKVVELRKAGLSFRKIKAVLELEDIKVSAQAIYLFLREFEGRPMVRVKPAEAGSSTSSAQALARTRTAQQNWSDIHLHNLLREATQQSGFTSAPDFAKQTSPNSEATANSSGPGETNAGRRPEQQYKGNKDEKDIQIVSVTSLAQHSQQRASQTTVTRAETSAVPSASSLATSAALMRKRVTPSPATSAMLAARKRLLDKALSQRMKVASLLRRDHAGIQGSDMRSSIPQPPETYNLTSDKTVMEAQPGSSSTQRRFLTQRPGPPLRSLHPLPRVGIRLPSRPLAPGTSSASGPAVIRLQTPGSQGATRSERIPSPQQTAQDAAVRCSLPDQVHMLSSEMRSLGFAVKMLVEQQCRLEREQVQQTQIQREILSTLQTLTSKMGSCSRVQQQHNKTPSPSALPAAPATTSFSQDTFSFSPNSFTQCSQTQTGYNSLESLDNVDAFKLPELRPTSMNDFPPCSNAESLPLTHTPPQAQTYAAPYTEQNNQTLMPPYTQSFVSSYNQSLPGTFGVSESKTSNFHISCAARTFHDCSVSSPSLMNSNHSSQGLNIANIKVEAP